MKLNNREKILIYILGLVIVISICGKFLITPAIKRIDASKMAIEQSENEKYKVVTTTEELKDIGELLKNEVDRAISQSYFYYNIDEVFADKLIQTYTKNYDIEITKLSFSGGVSESTSAYSNGIIDMITNIIMSRAKIYEEANTVPSGDLEYFIGNSAQIAEGTEEGTEDISPVISCYIEVNGYLDNIVKMVDQINNSSKSIHVSYIKGDVVLDKFDGSIIIDLYYFK